MRLSFSFPFSGSDRDRPPLALKYRSAKWFIVTTVCMAVFTDMFLYGVIVPVIPFALESRVGVPADQVQYYVSVLLAVYGAALLAASRTYYLVDSNFAFCGYFADHSSSRRLPLVLGLLALAGSTAMLVVGNSIGVLIAGRILQGVSAAVVWTVGLALLVDTVGSRDVGQAMGYVGTSMSLALLVAPLLGGVVFDRGGYYAVFAMAFGLIGLDVALRMVMVEKKVAARWTGDGTAAAGAAAELADVVPAAAGKQHGHEEATKQHQRGADEPTSHQRLPSPHSAPPRPPPAAPPHRTTPTTSLPPVLTLLTSHRLLSALFGYLTAGILLTSFDSVLPLFVHRTFLWPPTAAGLIFLPLVLPFFLSPLIGYLSDRHGPRWLATAGFALAPPLLICLRFVTTPSLHDKILLCALLALIGAAINLTGAPLMAEITHVVGAKEASCPGLYGRGGAYAQAYALLNVAFAAGTLVGPIWGGLVNERVGWGTMAWSLGLLSAVAAVPTAWWAGGSVRKGRRWKREGEGEGTGEMGLGGQRGGRRCDDEI